jgi:acyl carrier protein
VGLAQEDLFQLLGCCYPQIAVANIDWSVFTDLFSVRRHRPLFEVVAPGAGEPMVQSEATSSLRSRIDGLSPAECLDELIAFVRTEVASIMKFEASQLPEPKLGFAAMGMDSLMAIELRNRLQSSLSVVMPATIAFDCPDVERLAAYLANEIWGRPGDVGERPTSPYGETVPNVSNLAREELDELIVQKIEAIESLMTKR